MSITAAVARVSEIEAMLGQAGGAAAPAATPATSFDQQLQQASAAGPGLGASLTPAVAGTGRSRKATRPRTTASDVGATS